MITIMRGRRARKKPPLKWPEGKKNNNPTAGSSSSAPPPPWIELPRDVTANILRRLGPVEILESAQKVCTTWRTVCKDPAMWRVVDMKNSDDGLEIFYDPDTLCRRAVDRSQGELIDINIEDFGTDDLLRYISDRSSHLNRLRLACCDHISGKGLTTAVKNFPELEELHLFFMPSIRAGDIETISISCPMLKSFTFNDRWCSLFPLVDNSYALTIAQNMPNLCHLRFFGNKLSDEGLQAILDGCPHLESLDLRQCFSVYLRGDLDKRCFEQIKDVRCPFDSTADYEWDDNVFDDRYFYGSSGIHSFGDYEDYYDDYTNPPYDNLDLENSAWNFNPDN